MFTFSNSFAMWHFLGIKTALGFVFTPANHHYIETFLWLCLYFIIMESVLRNKGKSRVISGAVDHAAIPATVLVLLS